MLTMNLKTVCESNGVTLSELQRQTGLTFTMLRRYWTGNTDSYKREPSAAIYKFLRDSYGIEFCQLFTVEETDTPTNIS